MEALFYETHFLHRFSCDRNYQYAIFSISSFKGGHPYAALSSGNRFHWEWPIAKCCSHHYVLPKWHHVTRLSK